METRITTPSTSLTIDGEVHLSLARHADQGLRIVILPAPGHGDVTPHPTHAPRSSSPLSPDDNLANATWEDAEWR